MKIIITFLLTLTALLVSCIDAQKIQVRGLSGVKIGRVSATGIDARAQVSIRNENSSSLELRSLEAVIMLGDSPLGYVKTLEKVELPGNFDGVLEVPFNVRVGQLGFVEIGMIASYQGAYRIKGQARLGSSGLGAKFKFDEVITAAQVRQILNI